jgi:group II intron reverse transcriptase/maturase/CRISPR-associated endonuclease Cas1
MLPIEHLLPLRALDITLQFTDTAHIRLFHQPALTAWLRHLMGEVPGYEQYLTLDAPESGRVYYQAGDYYRFSLITLAGGEHLLQLLLDQLVELPHSVTRRDLPMPFRDNLIFHSAYDVLQSHPIQRVDELTPYTLAALQQEAEYWQRQEYCGLRWLAPVRLLLPNQPQKNRKGEMRFCRHRSQLDFALLNNRLYDSLAELLRQRVSEVPPRQTDETHRWQAADLFWIDYSYRDKQGKEKPMGGLLGRLIFATTAISTEQWQYWVLGQYLGIGQRRIFGWGRYQLETTAWESTMVRSSAASSLLMLATTAANLQAAYVALHDNPAEEAEEDDDDLPVDRLARLGEHLLRGEYVIPTLQERTLPKSDGTSRLLQVPPFLDRVAQRAVAQILTPALDTLMYSGSFGFRRGRSRHTASRMIQSAYQEGYRWVLESDVDDFFDNIQWARLYTRLTAFFGDDPVVNLVMQWMSAPLRQQGQAVERQVGLPQGSPLSPLLANIMLDDFDSDLEHAGLKLVRFADDFVILCRTQAEAAAAVEMVIASLAEVGLQLNQQKTAVRSFAQGFRYLGYLFVNDLVLDVGGEQAPTLMSSKAPNPTTSMTTKSIQPKVIRVDEMEASGTVVFVSGTPAIVTTLEEQLRLLPVADEESDHAPEPLLSLPWRQVQAVVLLGAQHHITTPALRAALQHGVAVHFADSGGHYQGCTWSGVTEEQQLWLAQVTWFSHPDNVLPAARSLVVARLRHQREVLRQRNLQHRFDESLKRLERLANQSSHAIDLASLRGFEGQGAKCYFEALSALLPTWVGFTGRHRRPPPDPFNALLSLGYTILYAHVETVIRVGGLLPWVGFYHQPHGHHAVLVSDLIEPFRHLVERVALNAVSKKQLTAEDFVMTANQGCRLRDEARRRYLTLLSERFETPFRGQQQETAEKLFQHLHWQVQMVKLWIRGQQAQFSAWRSH